MKITFSNRSWEAYLYWQGNNETMIKRINALIQDISRNSFEGIGQSGPLKHDWSGYWSPRIDQEHRLVYEISDDTVFIAQCRFLY